MDANLFLWIGQILLAPGFLSPTARLVLVFRKADAALHIAKQSGRNRLQSATD